MFPKKFLDLIFQELFLFPEFSSLGIILETGLLSFQPHIKYKKSSTDCDKISAGTHLDTVASCYMKFHDQEGIDYVL